MTVRTTKTKAKGKAPASAPDNSLKVGQRPAESEHKATARVLVTPGFRHGQATAQILKGNMGDSPLAPGMGDYADVIDDGTAKVIGGDLTLASRMLAAQAMTLDSIFTETARRMALNMGEHLGAMEIYARIALKAQANSRATIEALAKLHQPREQTVRHVHVNEGGQAVIADEFHHHQHGAKGGQENGQSSEQPHATGTRSAGAGPALPCPDPIGSGVPLASGEGKGTVQDARRQG